MTAQQAAGLGFFLMAALLTLVWWWMGRAVKP